jgi:hypothetical protein
MMCNNVTLSKGQELKQSANLLVLISCLRVLDEVYLVLQDEDVLQFHDLNRSQVFGRLRLRTRLISG